MLCCLFVCLFVRFFANNFFEFFERVKVFFKKNVFDGVRLVIIISFLCFCLFVCLFVFAKNLCEVFEREKVFFKKLFSHVSDLEKKCQ